jgi:hypothetical protein
MKQAILILIAATGCGGVPFVLGAEETVPDAGGVWAAVWPSIDFEGGEDGGQKADGGREAKAPTVDAAPGIDSGPPLGAIPDAAPDAVAVVDAGPIPDAACLTDGGMPLGTIALASGGTASNMSEPARAIDGVVATSWNANDYNGWIELYFPAPTMAGSIQLIANGSGSTEIYTLSGVSGGTTTPLGSWTFPVAGWGTPDTLPTMRFPQNTFDAIRIDVQGGSSWVAINEIAVGCK